MSATYTRTVRQSLMWALGSTIATFVVLWLIFSRSVSATILILLWLACINISTFLYYAWDKRQAGRDGKRIPEGTLHTLSLLGGSPGAYGAMRYYRHKTIKGRFRVLFWFIVLLQAIFLIWFIWNEIHQ